MWKAWLIQPVLIWVGVVGTFRFLKNRKKVYDVGGSVGYVSRRVLVVGAVVLLVSAVTIPGIVADWQKMFEVLAVPGEELHHVHLVERDGRFFVETNRIHIREISAIQYSDLSVTMIGLFDAIWVPLAYLCLVVWDLLRRCGVEK